MAAPVVVAVSRRWSKVQVKIGPISGLDHAFKKPLYDTPNGFLKGVLPFEQGQFLSVFANEVAANPLHRETGLQ